MKVKSLVARDDRVGVDGTHVDVVSFPAVEVGDDVHGIDGDAGFVEGRPDEGVRVPPAGQLVGTRPAGFDGWPTTRCRKAGSPRLLAYMGRYRSVLHMVATSNLRGPSLGSGMGTSS